MPTEIEAKMALADRAGLEARLAAVGAVRGPTILETNTFFDTAEGALRAVDRGLRIRVEREEGAATPPRVIVTHKGPRAPGAVKSRTETELVCQDAQAASALLQALGMVEVLSFEKRRRKWSLDGCHIDLDELPRLGEFVEIEGPDEATVLAVRQKLGLARQPLIRESYIALLKDHLARHGLHTPAVRFDPA